MKVVFMGSPAFAVPSLQALIDSRHTVVAVFSQPPRPAGRGHKLQKTPVHLLAEQHGIPVWTPKKLSAADVKTLTDLAPDVICVAAYGLILPQSVLNVAPCVNVHPSALPRWRGAAPMNHTLLAGDTTTQMCIMQMEAGLDSGPVYLRHPVVIEPNETAGDLHTRMAALGAACLLKVINHLKAYDKKKKRQPWWRRTTYAHKFKPADLPHIRALDFSLPAAKVHNRIRGLSPWPGATCVVQQTDGRLVELKVLRSAVVPTSPTRMAPAGTLLSATPETGLLVACGRHALRLHEVQRAGKQAMTDTEFLKGTPLNGHMVLNKTHKQDVGCCG